MPPRALLRMAGHANASITLVVCTLLALDMQLQTAGNMHDVRTPISVRLAELPSIVAKNESDRLGTPNVWLKYTKTRAFDRI